MIFSFLECLRRRPGSTAAVRAGDTNRKPLGRSPIESLAIFEIRTYPEWMPVSTTLNLCLTSQIRGASQVRSNSGRQMSEVRSQKSEVRGFRLWICDFGLRIWKTEDRSSYLLLVICYQTLQQGFEVKGQKPDQISGIEFPVIRIQ
ncbi:hypothetical protein D1AOALGA4SA_10969 [Olavius algarvensis Delta 1 endosymbiont]|nr:hypothetical protein D1AOALGA4SA_10969 [Olavius algarvensis Delta 1 endosymbiont]